ncbi:FREM3 [Mytilus coruscus]|uniref:FREM3 n=1 Tax=Mytilus coruscus TaxID=42192 RepID=A0A6J8DH22_MYTCO|nr:FREM3 [Mytilus coruscus]
MRLPLYVSYVFHALSGDREWRHIDTQTELEMTFVYNTAVLLDDGITSSRSSDTDGFGESLFPASMKIINNRLVVTFRTKARFRGQFVMNYPGKLMGKRDLWLSENKDEEEVDMAFSPGGTLYGRIDSSADLGQKINLGIDKDPLAPDTVDTSVDGIQFKVLLVRDDPRVTSLVQQTGADGFSIDTEPLFEADNDRVWFLHSVYSLKADRQKRDLASEGQNINQPGTGTNNTKIRTTTRPQPDADLNLSRSVDEKQSNTKLLPVLIGLSILFIIILILLIVLMRKHKKRSSPPPSPTSTITVVDRKGNFLVVHLPDSKSTDQRSEV